MTSPDDRKREDEIRAQIDRMGDNAQALLRLLDESRATNAEQQRIYHDAQWAQLKEAQSRCEALTTALEAARIEFERVACLSFNQDMQEMSRKLLDCMQNANALEQDIAAALAASPEPSGERDAVIEAARGMLEHEPERTGAMEGWSWRDLKDALARLDRSKPSPSPRDPQETT
jgi:hypothetical protein